MTKKFGVKDIFFLSGMFLLGIILTVAIYMSHGSGGMIRITRDGAEIGNYSLAVDREIVLHTPQGEDNTIVIKDGKAAMKTANCPDGLCVIQGQIEREGQTIICLPHKLVVEVYDAQMKDIDSVSGW